MTPTSEDNARNSVNGVLGLGKPMTLTSGGDALLTACTLSSSDSGGVLLEKCGNPLCREVLEPKKRGLTSNCIAMVSAGSGRL